MAQTHLPQPYTPRWERRIAAGMIALSACLMLIFSLGPIFEGPDEIEHYRYIRTLVKTHALPDPFGQPRGEYHQAPLYYLLNVPLALLVHDGDFAAIEARRNPYYGSWIDVPGNDNKNLYLHSRAEAFPYEDSPTARAVHLLRLISVALGMGTVITAYAVFRRLWPDHPTRRLLALGVVAFWPQFLYLSGTLNNDNLLFLLATITLWRLVCLLKGSTQKPFNAESAESAEIHEEKARGAVGAEQALPQKWARQASPLRNQLPPDYMREKTRAGDGTGRGAVWLGLALGALMLTKVSAVFVAVPVVLALGFLLGQNRRAWRTLALTLGIALIVAGWWYVRNAVRYHDPAGTRAVLTTWKSETIRPGKLALDIGLKRAPFAYQTVWARLGQGAVAAGSGIYTFFDGLVIATGIGLAISVILAVTRRRATRQALRMGSVVAIFAIIWIGALLYWACTAWSGNQGRYLLPGIAAWGALAGFGLDRLLPRRVRVPGTGLLIGALIVSAAVTLFGYFRPAYRISPLPDKIARPVHYRYEDLAELIGMAPANPKARPGETIQITLYWRALRPGPATLQAYVHSVESDVVRRDSLPATGNLLASEWKPGETWAEHYVVKIPAQADPQHVYTLVAGLYDPASGRTLDAANARGEMAAPVIGRIAINGPSRPLKTVYRFGSLIGLDQPVIARQGDQVSLCLRWKSLAATGVDYTVFVHIVDENGQPVTQADVQPKGGGYPTGAWRPGEVIDDCLTLDAPGLSGGWRAALGLYWLNDQGQSLRLPVRDAQGHPVPDDSVIIAGPGG